MAQEMRRLLIEAHEAADLTQTELANRLGRTQSLVSNYERGQRRLDLPEFILVCRALGVDPHELMRRVE
jgi:transcriptional regulator with XRE-family HTH domain